MGLAPAAAREAPSTPPLRPSARQHPPNPWVAGRRRPRLLALSLLALALAAWPATWGGAAEGELPVMPGGRLASRVMLDGSALGLAAQEIPFLKGSKALLVTYFLSKTSTAAEVLRFYEARLSAAGLGIRSGARPIFRTQNQSGEASLGYVTHEPDGLVVVRTEVEADRRKVEVIRLTADLGGLLGAVRAKPPEAPPRPFYRKQVPIGALKSVEVDAAEAHLELVGEPGPGAQVSVVALTPEEKPSPVAVSSDGAKGVLRVAWRGAAPQPGRRLELRVPQRLAVTARVRGGFVSAAGAFDRLAVEADSAPVSVSGATGDLRIRCEGAPLRVEGFTGRLEAHTRGAGASVTRSRLTSGASRLTTVGGTLDVSLEGLSADALDLRADDGSVELALPPDASAALDFQAAGGPIESRVPLTASPGHPDRRTGRLGDGRARVTVRTTRGSITLR